MSFTAQELANIANASLDFYVKGPAFKQSIQDKPLLKHLEEGKKEFPGGKENISIPVKGDYTTTIQGYTHNDKVGYANPANIKRVRYPWRELHAGIAFTGTEMKENGLTIVDSDTGKEVSQVTGADQVMLTNLIEDKLDDLGEGWARDFNLMLWQDGTADAKKVAGIQSIITINPALGTTGGLDRSTTPWWRNRSVIGIVPSASLQTLTKTLRAETRQLNRYAKSPKRVNLCGSRFIEALELELTEKGYYSQTGFTNNGKNDVGVGVISLRGLGDFEYDPTLDDMGLASYCYALDLAAIKLRPMSGEDKRQHYPKRPYDQYVFYRALTWTGGLTAQQLNSSGVYSVNF